MRCREHSAIDSAHLLDLHPNLDDLQLVQARDFIGTVSLLTFAQRDLVRQAYEFAMSLAIGPSAAAHAEKRVGRSADVAVRDEAERCLVTQLRAHVGPL